MKPIGLTRHLDVEPDDALRTIADVHALPGWNKAITRVLEDGNPSYADWTWTVAEAPGGCEVTVTWTLNPQTFWRRVPLGRVRQHQLVRTEVPTSLVAPQAAVATAVAHG